jgi:hypothetical protein
MEVRVASALSLNSDIEPPVSGIKPLGIRAYTNIPSKQSMLTATIHQGIALFCSFSFCGVVSVIWFSMDCQILRMQN